MSTRSDRGEARRANPGVLALVVLSVLLAACSSGPGPGTGTGTVAGEVVVGATGAQPGEPGVGLEPIARDIPEPEFMPGELIVAYEPLLSGAAAAPTELRVANVTLRSVRPLGIEGATLYQASAGSLRELLQLAAALEARPDVRYAHPNYILHPAVAPNDPEYDRQWHYDAIDMEGAWDITTGSSEVTVAVLDTGILYSQTDPSLRHPDLVGRVLPGYDFVSNVSMAKDGDGRDPDPYDSAPEEDYHGTHVAGTIGAATNNGVGVAGVDWNAKLLPVRVIGAGGGTISDIADAIRWAVGGSVPGVPSNPDPADVLNLSLGAEFDECAGALQDAIDYASQLAIVVVAAGNANMAANGFTPANCAGPIVVGATDRDGYRAWYSNYGARIDVMAPGGDTRVLTSNGVLSTGGGDGYAFMQGTSMAAPHVSGIISLMLSVDPKINDVVALELLRASATPLSDERCAAEERVEEQPSRQLRGFDCGAGLIDARVALDLIESGAPPPPPVEGIELVFDPPVLDLGTSRVSAVVTVTNVGDTSAAWIMGEYYQQAANIDNPGPVPYGVVLAEIVGQPDPPDNEPLSGTLGPQESVDVRFYIQRGVLQADGYYAVQPIFEAGGQEFVYLVRFARQLETETEVTGPMVVAAFKEDSAGSLYTSGSQSSNGVIKMFQFDVESGRNLIGAWSDENENGEVDDGDFLGYRDEWANVPPDQVVSGLDVVVGPVVGEPAAPQEVIESLEAARGR